MKKYIQSNGEVNPFNPEQNNLLTFQTIRYVLGQHFNCPPHSWDDQPYDRVILDYMFVRAVEEERAEQTEKQTKDMKKRYNGGNNKDGRVIRTTSDADNLDDFFDLVNADMRVPEDDSG